MWHGVLLPGAHLHQVEKEAEQMCLLDACMHWIEMIGMHEGNCHKTLVLANISISLSLPSLTTHFHFHPAKVSKQSRNKGIGGAQRSLQAQQFAY